MRKTSKSYIIDNVKYDRVTSILGYFENPTLIKWKKRDGSERESSTAKRIGTRVHGLAFNRWKNGFYRLTPNDSISIRNCMEAYSRWLDIEKPSILTMEETVKDNELMVAGTYDMMMIRQLNDIKTSNKIYADYWIQLAIYAYMNKLDIEKLGILRLDKFTGDYEYKTAELDNNTGLWVIDGKQYDLVGLFKGLLEYYRYTTQKDENGNKNMQKMPSKTFSEKF